MEQIIMPGPHFSSTNFKFWSELLWVGLTLDHLYKSSQASY